MATNFPGSLDNSTSLPYPTSTSDTNSPSLAGGQDNQNDAVIATETKLGIGSSTAASNQVLTGTGSGSSAWQLLTAANVTYATGSGPFVFGTSPTLTSPTINSATISNPTLDTDSVVGYTTSNAGTVYGVSISGGKISSGGLAAGSVTYAELLSTIFSGQLTTASNSGSASGNNYYLNLGGIKILWGTGTTAYSIGGTSSTSQTVVFPNGFFSTIQLAMCNIWLLSASGNQVAYVGAEATTGITIDIVNNSVSTVGGYCEWFVIGT